jgi:DNA-binding cell septation regulator SpoVG
MKEDFLMAKVAKTGVKLDCRAYPIKEPKNKTVAFASVTINELVGINGIQIIDGKNGLFAKMPQMKFGDEYRDLAFPVMKGLRAELNNALVDTYLAEKDKVSVKDTIKDGQSAAKNAPAKVATGRSSKSQTEQTH